MTKWKRVSISFWGFEMGSAVTLIFNELSESIADGDELAAASCIETFCRLVIDPRCRPITLITPSHFLQSEVVPGYSVGRVLASESIEDEVVRKRAKSLLANSRKDFEEYESEAADSECRLGECRARGLGLAHRLGGIGVSFLSHERWNCSDLELSELAIVGDDLENRIAHVPHAANAAHLDEHEALLQQSAPDAFDGKTVWNSRGKLFPSLDFCDAVGAQLSQLSSNDPRLKSIFRGFSDLQSYCESWSDGHFDIKKISNASGESEPTMNQYSAERTFKCPDGEHRVFEWHVKRWRMRIHFIDLPKTKRILVGYAGEHLPISSQ